MLMYSVISYIEQRRAIYRDDPRIRDKRNDIREGAIELRPKFRYDPWVIVPANWHATNSNRHPRRQSPLE